MRFTFRVQLNGNKYHLCSTGLFSLSIKYKRNKQESKNCFIDSKIESKKS